VKPPVAWLIVTACTVATIWFVIYALIVIVRWVAGP
jgi:hypothetical protein